MKISKNDVDYVSNLYIKFLFGNIKKYIFNEYFTGAWFLFVHPVYNY